MALTTTQTSPAQQTAATPASPEGEKPAQGQAHAAAPVRLMTCPHCRRAVPVMDVAFALHFAEHRDVYGQLCAGSRDKVYPTSDEVDTELEEGLVDL